MSAARGRAGLLMALLLAPCLLAPTCGPTPANPDIDGDGTVTLADLAIVQACFGETAPLSPGCALADVVSDGRIDVLDASRVASELAPVLVPDVVALPLAQAHADLVAAGLQLGTVSEVPHLLVPSGTVIGPTPAAGSELAPGSPVDLLLSAPVPAETTVLGSGWQGTWAITTTFSDASTGTPLSIETDVVELCDGDPLGLSLAPGFAVCSGDADDVTLSFACHSATEILGCTIGLDVDFALDRTGDTIAGAGGFSLGGPVVCPGVLDPEDDSVQIQGTRVTTDAPSCVDAPVAASQKLVRHPRLMEGLRP